MSFFCHVGEATIFRRRRSLRSKGPRAGKFSSAASIKKNSLASVACLPGTIARSYTYTSATRDVTAMCSQRLSYQHHCGGKLRSSERAFRVDPTTCYEKNFDIANSCFAWHFDGRLVRFSHAQTVRVRCHVDFICGSHHARALKASEARSCVYVYTYGCLNRLSAFFRRGREPPQSRSLRSPRHMFPAVES